MAQCIKCNATIPDGTQYCDKCSTAIKMAEDESYLDDLLSSITPSDALNEVYSKNKGHHEHSAESDLDTLIPKDYNIFNETNEDLDFLNSLFDGGSSNLDDKSVNEASSGNEDVKDKPDIMTIPDAAEETQDAEDILTIPEAEEEVIPSTEDILMDTDDMLPDAEDLEPSSEEEPAPSIDDIFTIPDAEDLEPSSESEPAPSIDDIFTIPDAEDLEPSSEEEPAPSMDDIFTIPDAEDLEPSSESEPAPSMDDIYAIPDADIEDDSIPVPDDILTIPEEDESIPVPDDILTIPEEDESIPVPDDILTIPEEDEPIPVPDDILTIPEEDEPAPVPDDILTAPEENDFAAALDEDISSMIPDLMPDTNDEKQSANQEDNNSETMDDGKQDEMSDNDKFEDNDQDILDLINEINSSEELPMVEDISDYHDDNTEAPSPTDFGMEKLSENPTIGDIFSDALGAVSSLDDSHIDDELLNMIPNLDDREENVLDTKADVDHKNQDKKKKKRKGLIARIFGNVREDLSEEEIERRKQNVISQGEKKELEKKSKLEAEQNKKAQQKAEKEEKAKLAKEEAAKKKQEKAAEAKAKKEEKAKRSREIQELIDEIDENEGKINKIGASIVFTFFAAAAIVIIIGTNLYSYAVNIKNASNNFSLQRYNDAYKDVYGMDIRDEDMQLYEKIMTVMFVNKQLNSYENYCLMERYPDALDSLLKGLQRYEKYYMLATKLGIETDLDDVKEQIVSKLDETFHMSEKDAMKLLEYDNQEDYSAAVYSLVADELKMPTQSNKDTDKSQKK